VEVDMSWKQDKNVSPVTRGDGVVGKPMDSTAIKKLW